ncbi:MAG: DUF11 domain-containing protein [Gemmatimonadales bacterium]|nr:DUF11 domain-containing protein [Gemmatimonadales bacterium]
MYRRIQQVLKTGVWCGLVCFAVAVLTAKPASAQTPEGTVIRNIATVTFTDANNNTYAPVADTVDVTVGFAAALNVTGAATATPASPSTSNVLTFTIGNVGNGEDTVTVSETISVAGIISVTGYTYNATTYPSLAALNAVLSAVPIASGGSITVDVVYDVLAGQGGNPTDYTLTATSVRDAAESDFATTTITPAVAIAVAVTPDGGQLLQDLPSNGAPPYQFTFTVTNNGNTAEDFDLSVTSPGSAAITVVSVNGTAGTTSTLSALGVGASASVIVEYTIGAVAAGTTDTLYLTATSVSAPATTDDGFADVTVVAPTLTITKQAWLGDRSAQISGNVLPGDFIEYRVEVTNAGGADATSVVVSDALPAEVAFISSEDPGASFASIVHSGAPTGGTVTATLSGPLAAGNSAFFWVRTQVQ